MRPFEKIAAKMKSHGMAHAASEKPAELARIAASEAVVIDVREELRAGREPFHLIMAARDRVISGGALCVRATFEPLPLYAVMRKQGFEHWTEMRADDDWVVWFYSSPAQTVCMMDTLSEPPAEDPSGEIRILDVRGLEPPEPMVQTLAALETLPAGATLVQVNARIPKFLLPLLEERGYSYEIREQGDDLVRLFIRRSHATQSEVHS